MVIKQLKQKAVYFMLTLDLLSQIMEKPHTRKCFVNYSQLSPCQHRAFADARYYR